MTGVLALLAGLLQLVVPSYALRLVRRFGVHRVGWFVVTAFSSLALLHLVAPLRPTGTLSGSVLDVMFVAGSVLLLIGMGHMETLFSEREQAHSKVQNIRIELDTKVVEKTTTLSQTNQKLLEEIARREEKQKALAVSEASYRFLFAENPQPMWIFDLRSCHLLAGNSAALRQYGFSEEEFVGLTVWDLLPTGANSAFEEEISKSCSTARLMGVVQHCTKDRTLIDVEVTALDMMYGDSPARLIVANEVTHRHQRELEVRKTQKREAISQVTAGVAQHFSSILSEIENNAAALLPIVQDPKAAEQLKHITGAVNRGSGLTRKLLAVGCRRSMQLEVLDLNALIRNMSHMLSRLVGERIVINNAYGPRLTPILADPRLVEEIMINLILNARDAMSRTGTISINTSSSVLDRTSPDGQSKTEQFVCLSVRDTGPGMSPDVQACVFQPFFTTRDSGQSFGLGLASIYGLAQQHSGWVEFTSRQGHGTEFKVFLPCAPASAILAQGESRRARPEHKGTLMLVEPDDRVRSMARFVLNQHGYKVVEADCGSIALLLWESQASDVDLLLTDLSLPGDISGFELADRLQKSKPDLKVIYTSNGTPAQEGLRFLPKPYRPDRLMKEVQGITESEPVAN
jgi:two-component system cell cycle sensor histidine kinase/response regulator CckA